MGSLHWQQTVMRKYHTRGTKMKQKNFQLVTIFGRYFSYGKKLSLFGREEQRDRKLE
jgi:hypothetical protein